MIIKKLVQEIEKFQYHWPSSANHKSWIDCYQKPKKNMLAGIWKKGISLSAVGGNDN